jgi:hypothetical protein
MLEQTKIGPARGTLGRPTLEDANHRSNADVHFVGYLLDRESCCSQSHYFITIEDPTRAPNSVPGLRAVRLGGLHASTDPLSNQFPFELRHGGEDV